MLPRFVAILCLLAISTQPLLAKKRWAIKNVEITALVDSAGYMTIEEKRTYQFWGKFSYAFYDLSLAGLLDVDQVQVLEDGETYQLSTEKTPGTFLIGRESKKISIRWQFREEGDRAADRSTIREFTLRFRVLGAVRVHRDVAELYYKFVGAGWDRASEKVRVTIQLPKMNSNDDVRVWAHGPLHGHVSRQPNGIVNLSIDHLPRGEFFEARVVFPKQAVAAAAAAVQDDREALPEILQQETQWAEAANQKREKAAAHEKWQAANREKYASWMWLGLAAGIVFSLYMYQRYGRSLRRGQDTMSATAPTDMPPAVANYILNARQLSGGALLATLFDLAARGYLQLRQEKSVSRFLGFSSTKWEGEIVFEEDKLRFAPSELLPYERLLLEFLRTDLAQNRRELSFAEITKQSSQIRRFFEKWKKAVALQAGKPKLYDSASVRASLITFAVWLLIIAANAFGIHALGEENSVPFLAVSIIFAPLSFVILRHDRETAEKLDRLHAFRRYLKRFSRTPQNQSAPWQHVDNLLVYATALNLSGAQIRPLVDVINHQPGAIAFPWFIYSSGDAATGISAAMAAMVDVAGTALSSASGSGGEASTGGGGGAGGSGGGAG
ncbi:DUF2207 domain-containing protein [candidate division KSB1 bacterium]|nr:DUF2207 domain-containing protein [candidate division KSB1 bacterium]